MSLFREAAAATVVAVGVVWIGPQAWEVLDNHEFMSNQVKDTYVGSFEMVRHPVTSAGIVVRGVLHETRAVLDDGERHFNGTKQAGNDNPTGLADIFGRLTINYVAAPCSMSTGIPAYRGLLNEVPPSVVTI